ncbi:Signal recognition particle, SRP14 subunit [Dillenia turbinata]|uniref:Signal recognition particle 14 kDa protein n=1 Tax=Dillenia turbinata TaxID=194707 RepID=A0AAN8VSA9_9MAGN
MEVDDPELIVADDSDNEEAISLNSNPFSSMGLFKLQEESADYKIIKNSFLLGLKPVQENIEVVSIYKNLHSNFMTCGGNPNIRYAWFGTLTAEIHQIVSHGFNLCGRHENFEACGKFNISAGHRYSFLAEDSFLTVEFDKSFNLSFRDIGGNHVGVDTDKVLLQPDPFLNELTSMYERNTEKGSVWVTLKRSSLKSKARRNKMTTAGELIEYRCLIRATDGKKTISTSVGAKEHQRFQASYSTILKAHMTALKKRERKDKKKATGEADKKSDQTKKASGEADKKSDQTMKPSSRKTS